MRDSIFFLFSFFLFSYPLTLVVSALSTHSRWIRMRMKNWNIHIKKNPSYRISAIINVRGKMEQQQQQQPHRKIEEQLAQHLHLQNDRSIQIWTRMSKSTKIIQFLCSFHPLDTPEQIPWSLTNSYVVRTFKRRQYIHFIHQAETGAEYELWECEIVGVYDDKRNRAKK